MSIDVGAKAIIVLSETGESARYVAKFHPDAHLMAVMESETIGRQIEGYMSSACSVITQKMRGDGAHVKVAFQRAGKGPLQGRRRGDLHAHDAQHRGHETVHGARPLRHQGDPHMYTRAGIDRRPTTEEFEPPAKKSKK